MYIAPDNPVEWGEEVALGARKSMPDSRKTEQAAIVTHPLGSIKPLDKAMLSRTADSLYWLARYMERADFLARALEASRRLATLPKAYGDAETEWRSILLSAGAAESFNASGRSLDEKNVVEFLTFATDNPGSIRGCIEQARLNARAVRTALTREMWDTINSGYLEMKNIEKRMADNSAEDLTHFLDFIKQISMAYDGGAYRTMLRNDAYWFTRIGLFIERADNTARLLDVKYHVLLPEKEIVGGSLDYFQWNAILRAVSAQTSYHWVYRTSLKPWLVADLLILRPEMPRSLISCYESLVRNLDHLGRSHGRQGNAQRQALGVYGKLQNMTMENVFQDGLHEFVSAFLTENNQVGALISEQYQF